MQLLSGLADVEGMPDRRFADPVDHRGSRGLDAGHRRQFLSQLAFQRAGHHHRQVGLHQEVVDRRGQDTRHGGDRPGVVRAVDEHPAGRADRAAAHQAQMLRFFQEVGHRRGLQAVGPAGPPPDQCRRRGVPVDARTGWQTGEHAQQQTAIQGRGR
jgi:hypothetical protein